MKRLIMALVLATMLAPLAGCIFVDRDDRGEGRERHEGHEGHEDHDEGGEERR
jgi:Flp pilus assembly protein TadD